MCSDEAAMASIKVFDPVSVPLSVLMELQQLRAHVEQLRQENERLRQENERLRRELDEARASLDQAQRQSKRQAAPFSKGPPKPQPKTPGRKAGDQHGTHGHRPPPEPERIDETHEVPLPDACPGCGGTLDETHVDHQYQTDIPRQPVIRQFNVHCGRCRGCGQPCRGRHPLQTSDATGAAASQLGPDAQAAVVLLNKDAGLSHGKIARTFDALFGITLTRGACAQIVLRAGRRLRPAYAEIQQRLPASSQITPDETGWRVGGHPAWLHAWVGDDATCYVISPQRDAEALAAVIGWDWSGVLIHDGFASYERFALATHQQCVAHVLRRAHELEPTLPGAARRFPRQVIDLFQRALQVRDMYHDGTVTEAELAGAYTWYVDGLQALTERPRTNAANETLARHLWVHADHWFQFLDDPTLPATNYQAEQALRPAVVNRKVWGGNRTEAGAEAQGILMSVLQTCRQQVVSAVDYVRDTLCHGFASLFTPAAEAGR
jgi:transposase